MWLEHNIVELGEAQRNPRGYEVREYVMDWRVAGRQEP